MQSVLEEVAFGSNEDVTEEACEMFSELAYVKDLHFKSCVQNSWSLLDENVGTAKSTQPRRHESGPAEDFVAPKRANKIVDNRVAPLH